MDQGHGKSIVAVLILVIIAGIAVAAAWWWGNKEPAEEAQSAQDATLEIPSVNPIERVNPFNENAYKNPFE